MILNLNSNKIIMNEKKKKYVRYISLGYETKEHYDWTIDVALVAVDHDLEVVACGSAGLTASVYIKVYGKKSNLIKAEKEWNRRRGKVKNRCSSGSPCAELPKKEWIKTRKELIKIANPNHWK